MIDQLTDTADPRRAYVRSLCHHHSAALLTIASVLLDNIDDACEIVATTLAAAGQETPLASPAAPETRAALARSVYHRCLGELALPERYPQLPDPAGRRVPADLPLGHLAINQRAVVALTLFGAHDVGRITDTLKLTA